MVEVTVTVLAAGTVTLRVGVNVQVILLSPGAQGLHLAVNVEKLRRRFHVVVVRPVHEDKVLAGVPVHPRMLVSCAVIIVAKKVILKRTVGTQVTQAISLGLIIGRSETKRDVRGLEIGTDDLSPVMEEVGPWSVLARVPVTLSCGGPGHGTLRRTRTSKQAGKALRSQGYPHALVM